MTYVLNAGSIAAETAPAAKPAKAGPGFVSRLFTAMVESRRRSAIRELRARSYLVGESEIVLGGFPQTALTNDAALPFNR